MNSSEWVLKVILSRYPEPSRQSLERFLPKEEMARLHKMPSAEVDTTLEESPLLERVHWSWLLPILESKGAKEQKLFLSALSPFARENLARELKMRTPPPEEENRLIQEFVHQSLLEALVGKTLELLPVYFLPPTPLAPLLRMEKQELVDLIDSLSLIDLAAELRQIVETKILKKIYSFLSEEEKRALKKAARTSQPIATARLHLEKWNGEEKSLRLLLHKRGIARLAAALSTQHPDFVWYICHQLDIGRGRALERLSEKEVAKSASQQIIHQLEDLLRETA